MFSLYVFSQTISVRAKGSELDYRFLPEPNLPRLRITKAHISEARRSLRYDAPHLRYVQELNFPLNFAYSLIADAKLSAFIERCISRLQDDGIEPARALAAFRYLEQVFSAVHAKYPPTECVFLIDLLFLLLRHFSSASLLRMQLQRLFPMSKVNASHILFISICSECMQLARKQTSSLKR